MNYERAHNRRIEFQKEKSKLYKTQRTIELMNWFSNKLDLQLHYYSMTHFLVDNFDREKQAIDIYRA